MAEQFFIQVLNMSLTGSFVILAVLAMRIFLRKAPRIFSYCLWAAVLFRLLCPVSFSAVFSPLNALRTPLVEHGRIEYIPEDFSQLNPSAAQPDSSEANHITVVLLPDEETLPSNIIAIFHSEFILKAGAAVWLSGILIMVLYSTMALIRLMHELKTAPRVKDNIYITDRMSTPFVIGFLKPRIYLPSTLDDEEEKYILLHEQIHLKRKDHLFKIIAFLALCLHWFNPLVWIAFFLSGKDMEMSCDEAVIRIIGSSVKKKYSTSLLNMSTGNHIVNGVLLAFGKGDTSSRIRNVLHYRKPTALAAGIAAVVCAVTVFVLLANPKTSEVNSEGDFSPVYYGVVTEVMSKDTTYTLLTVPGIGEMEIPKADEIFTYFEREKQELLPGDMIAVTFSEGEEVTIQETWPARFSQRAESIVVMWEGLALENTEGDTYRLTFPGGVVPEVSNVKLGDILSIYWEEPEDTAFLTQVPESQNSTLLAAVPILAVGENEYGTKVLTIELSASKVQSLLSGFGFHLRFALESNSEIQVLEEKMRTILEIQVLEEKMRTILESLQQEQEAF